MSKHNSCETGCTLGWMNKRVFGLTLAVWVVFFAILPHTARGVVWTASTLAGWTKSVSSAVVHDRPAPADRPNGAKRGN